MKDPFFKLAYKQVNGKWLTKNEYLSYVHQKEAKEIIRLDSRAAKVRKVIEAMPDRYIRHSHATPLHLVRKPTRKELEEGIPQCCHHETMQVSWFDNDRWYCWHCRKSRLR